MKQKGPLEKMRILRPSLRFAALVMLFHLTACTPPTTKFSAIWKDETYQARPEKIFVVGASGGSSPRRDFEDEFVMALKVRGIDAVVSYTSIPQMPAPVLVDKDAIVVQAKAVGADTVLINSLIQRERKDVWVDTNGTDRYELYINTRLDVYDVKTNRMIMSVLAEKRIYDDKPYTGQLQSFVRDLVNMLFQQKLF